MKPHTLFVLSLAALGATVATLSQAAGPPTYEGLVTVQSRNLDQFYLRPDADLAGYRKVIIDPVQVTFRKDWNRDFVDPHAATTHRLVESDVRRITEDTAAGMTSAVADAFKAKGYEIATAPGPGVLRLSPSVTELYVNATDVLPPGVTKSFTNDAGEATLILEARDSVSGALLSRVVDHRTARENTKGTQVRDLRRTTGVSNNFWFDTMFRRWATACVSEFAASKPRIG